jgi:hypothetical protein
VRKGLPNTEGIAWTSFWLWFSVSEAFRRLHQHLCGLRVFALAVLAAWTQPPLRHHPGTSWVWHQATLSKIKCLLPREDFWNIQTQVGSSLLQLFSIILPCLCLRRLVLTPPCYTQKLFLYLVKIYFLSTSGKSVSSSSRVGSVPVLFIAESIQELEENSTNASQINEGSRV